MGLASAELEIVRYKTKPIAHAINSLVFNFSDYSGIEGTDEWPMLLHDVMGMIKNQEGFFCRWVAKGVDINISYFDDPRPGLRNGNLVYATPEPQIAFYEKPDTVSPAVRTSVSKAITDIAEEMQEVYHLRLKRGPLRIIFPNEEYAESVERFTVPLL